MTGQAVKHGCVPTAPTVPGARPASGVRYRVGQFLQGFAAQVTAAERTLAAELLPPAARALFDHMPVDAQRHSLNVLYAVQTAGFHDPDLAVAALLHDVGKIHHAASGRQPVRLGLWWRGPLVLLEAVAPGLLARWAVDDATRGWRFLLYLHLHHPTLGAAAARAAGCSEITCRLIAHHQDMHLRTGSPRFLELLRVLQWADSRN